MRARPWHTLKSLVGLSASLLSRTMHILEAKRDEVIRIVTSLGEQGSYVCLDIGATVRLGPKAEDTSLPDPISPLPKHILYVPISSLFHLSLRVPNEHFPQPVSGVTKRVARSRCASYASGSLARRV